MRARRGFSLLGAVWLLALISGLSLEIALSARYSRLAIANGFERDIACRWAEAGVAEVQAALSERLATRRADADASRTALRELATVAVPSDSAMGLRFEARLTDATSRANVNLLDATALRRVLSTAGIDDGDADAISQAIADWRDPDALPRQRGAEAPQYLAATMPVLPQNDDFRRIATLQRVMGMTPRNYERVVEYLTVRGSGRINVNTAPRPVLAAIDGFDARVLARLESLRAAGTYFGSADQLLAVMPAAERGTLGERRGDWEPRVAFELTEIEYEVRALDAANRPRCVQRGLLLRVGDAFMALQRETE